MKKLTLLLLVLALPLLLYFPHHVYADVYASGLRVTQVDSDAPFDGTFHGKYGAKINFILNDAAVVTVRIMRGNSVVKQIYAGPLPKGANYVIWDGSLDAGGPAPAGTYTFAIEASSNGYDKWTMFYDSEERGHLPIYTRGVDVNRDPTSKDFGYIYAGNNGGGLGYAILRMSADGAPAGDTLGYSLKKSFSWPGNTTGQVNYGLALDDLGRIYVSALDSGFIWRYDRTTDKVTKIISRLHWPRGLAIVGKGGTRTLYIASDSTVLRATIGDADVFTGKLDTIALFVNTRVVDVAFDDAGFMYVNLRKGPGRDGVSGGGLATEKYSISGKLPKGAADAIWSVKWPGSRPIGLGIYHGLDPTSNIDDRLYISKSEGDSVTGYGVWAIPKIYSDLLPTPVKVFTPPLGDISQRADLTVDVVGNIIFFENSYEHVYFISPPGPNSYTTYSGPMGVTINVVKPGISWRYFTISKAKEDANRDFVPDFKARDTIVLRGVVTTPNMLIASNAISYYMQDNTGGIDIYKGGTLTPELKIGDSVEVIGTIDHYRGLTEIVPLTTSHISVLKPGPNPKGPYSKQVTIKEYLGDAEYYESQLIRIDRMFKAANSPAWPAVNTDANMIMYTETPWGTRDTIIMRLSRSTNIPGSPEPTYPIWVRGVATQFTTKTPPNDGYQITPRFLDDISRVGWVGVGPEQVASAVPDGYVLAQNYPNPFNPTTTIEYGLPQSGMVKLAVYNVLGQQVALLVDGYKDAGKYRVVFDAKNLSSGTYFYVLIANGQMLKNKMLLLK